ncbi:MAG: hypothetical protein IKD16_04955, partial [Bacteroidales bacterium]|nr:hypothetical protein [Bacteroidales bacterium]
MRVAVLDLGTNVFNMLLASFSKDGCQYVDEFKCAAKLGGGGLASGKISESAFDTASAAMERIIARINESGGADTIIPYATSAVRDAANGKEFVRLMKERFGIDVRVIPGEREAEFIFKGIIRSLAEEAPETVGITGAAADSAGDFAGAGDGGAVADFAGSYDAVAESAAEFAGVGDGGAVADFAGAGDGAGDGADDGSGVASVAGGNILMLDIGGGSNEFIISDGKKVLWKESFPIGMARMRERFNYSEPIAREVIYEFEEYCNGVLEPLWRQIEIYRPRIFVGSSGSFDTFKDLMFGPGAEYKACRVLPAEDLLELHEKLLVSTAAERLAMPRMSPIRVDYIVLASIFTQMVLRRVEPEVIYQS